MWTIIIGGLITTALSLIGSRIAMWRARLWLDANKHKIKWEIIYTIFGPDPNNPLPAVPTPEPRKPWLPWRRKTKYEPWQETPPQYAVPPSKAEQWTGSLEFNFGIIAASVPFSYLVWVFTR